MLEVGVFPIPQYSLVYPKPNEVYLAFLAIFIGLLTLDL